MIPANLPLFVGLPDYADPVEKILKGEGSLEEHLTWFSGCKIRVWFSCPVQVRLNRYHSKMVAVHDFMGFFKGQTYGLCYPVKKHGRVGYPMGDLTSKIIKWEPVLGQDEFRNYDQFKAKFDLKFITESEIQKLWDGKSGQHGGKYRLSDFRRLGPKGQYVLKAFLDDFKGLGKVGPAYRDTPTGGNYKVVSAHYSSPSRCGSTFGRDITISCNSCSSHVYYSSEYPGCGNGRYGLLVNKKEFLWLEDD